MRFLFCLLILHACGSLVAAAPIEQGDIVPSTTLPALSEFPLEQINDGITRSGRPYNGFTSTEDRGTITLDLVGRFDLDSFLIWNDVNLTGEGIKDFRLDFFDSSNTLISPGFSATYTAPHRQAAAGEYVFDNVLPDVSRVDLVVLNSYQGSIFAANRDS